MGELATKGALGTLAYLALWGALVWAIVRRRRPPRDEVLAYSILGGLTAYFVQNLFLFDTPATSLQWTILVAWVAGQEQPPPDLAALKSGPPPPEGPRRLWSRWRGIPALAGGPAAMVQVATVTAIVVALSLSAYYLNYRPYAASGAFLEAAPGSKPLAQRLDLARQSFDKPQFVAKVARNVYGTKIEPRYSWGTTSLTISS